MAEVAVRSRSGSVGRSQKRWHLKLPKPSHVLEPLFAPLKTPRTPPGGSLSLANAQPADKPTAKPSELHKGQSEPWPTHPRVAFLTGYAAVSKCGPATPCLHHFWQSNQERQSSWPARLPRMEAKVWHARVWTTVVETRGTFG